MTAKGFVVVTFVFRQEGKVWTAECRELGTATYGRSLKRTHDELLEMVKDHLSVLEEVGERERFFKDHGIAFYSDESVPAEIQQSLRLDEEAYVQAHRVPISA
jgi:hypothetical protein